MFAGDNNASVYYLAGTTGWGAKFGGLPAFLWDPLLQVAYTTTNGTITITKYTGLGGAVTIPSTINGLPVTSIGDVAFSGCSGLTSVTIGSGVTSIGEEAFSDCTSLTAITIPNSVTKLGDSAFYGCTSLTSATIPNSVTRIGTNTFDSCNSLANVTIGNSVTNIGDSAFSGCSGLTNVTIGTNVTSIGDWAFAGCRLISVTIPNSVTNIGYAALEGCSSLTAITVDTNNPAYSSLDGVLFDKSQATLVQYPEGKAGTYYAIPNSVTNIGIDAFYYCTSLTKVTIANGVTSIGDGAFAGCWNLTSLTIPNSVTKIGGSAFSNCQDLTSVTIGSGVASIGEEAFSDCTSLTAITIPSSVTKIGDLAFFNCQGLTSVTIPNSVTKIGDGAFAECTSLTCITVEALNSSYISVDGVLFNKNQTTLIQYPVGQTGTSYTIPNSVTSIRDDAFYGCESLTGVTIPNSVTNIADSAFSGCLSLTSVYFQGNAPSFGADVFDYWSQGWWGPVQVWDPATIYYLPGTTGWDAVSTNTGLPVVLWTPQVQTSDASFGVRTNQFGFTITWASGMTVVVEACTNLANPTWSPVSTNTLTGGSSYFSDPQWTNYPSLFYRLRSP